MKANIFIFLALVFGVTAISFYAIETIGQKAFPLPVYGAENHTIQSFELTNQKGEEFNSKEHEGKIWVVNYFFTHCPSVCPKMMHTVQEVHDIVRTEEDVILLSFTVDPARDTPEHLMNYLSNYNIEHSSWQLLTGDKKELYRLARKSFLVSATEGNGDNNDFIHSENIVVIDKKGKIRAIINGTAADASEQILQVISKLKR